MKLKLLLQFFFFFICQITFGQIIVTLSPDNCMAPLPNSGTYTESGTLNGKPMYVKGANLRIVWTGTQWAIQGDDPGIAGVNWTTAWFNTKNSPTPPSDCWQASFGCFLPTVSGASTFPIVNASANPTIIATTNTTTTVTFTVTFSGAINGLTTSNFNVVATGVTGTSIASVTQTANPSIYTVVVNYGTGNGTVRLDIANDTGASAAIGCSGTFPIQGGSFSTYNAPVTLTAGDIAFTGYNSDPTNDEFSFIVLKPGGFPVGTKLFFTDNGFNNVTNTLNTNEGTMLFTVTTAIPQYAQIKITTGTIYTVTPLTTGAATAMSISTNLIALATAGDQVIAYQGYATTPTFISAIHLNADNTATGGTISTLTTWDDFNNGLNANRSYIPTGLTNGTNAVMVIAGSTPGSFTENDNAVYNCNGANGSTLAAVRASINDKANWTLNDTTPFTIAPICSFTLSNTEFDYISFNAFPNPTNGEIKIEFENFDSKMFYKIIDINGRELKFEEIKDKTLMIDFSNFSNGIYLLEIASKDGKTIKKIVKE